jgi:hypothetical protein
VSPGGSNKDSRLPRNSKGKREQSDCCKYLLNFQTRQPVVWNVAPADKEADNNGDARRGPIFAATPSANPRSLHVLWNEYERGIGGRRPAKLFHIQERGKVKHKYHRRKMV